MTNLTPGDTQREQIQYRLTEIKEHGLPILAYFQRRSLEKQLDQITFQEKSALIENYLDQLSAKEMIVADNGYQVFVDGKPFLIGKDQIRNYDFVAADGNTKLAARSADGDIVIRCERDYFACAFMTDAGWHVSIEDKSAGLSVSLSYSGTPLDEDPGFYIKTASFLQRMHELVDPLKQ